MEKALLERIVRLSQEQVDLEASKEKMEMDLKDINKRLEKIAGGFQSEGELPAAMQEAEISELALESGRKIKVNEELGAPSLAKDSKNRLPVLEWLKKNGHQDIIKSELKAQFTQDKTDKRLEQAIEALTKIGVPFDNYESANAQTFKSLLRELLEGGEELPMEELGIKIYRRSKVE